MEESDVHVTKWGSGRRVILVHGGTPGGGAGAFSAQKELEARWHLVLPDRPGHGSTAREGREDFERDADLLTPLLDPTSHVVGHSYGAIVALYMAATRPGSIRSLTLIEPPAFCFAREDPAVDQMLRANRQLFENPDANPETTVQGFFDLVGIDVRLPNPAPPMVLTLAQDLAAMRGPYEAEVDARVLREGNYPIQVLTSGRTAGFEAIARAIARQTGAQHVVVPGTDHSVQHAGAPVNEILERFWLAADGGAGAPRP